MHCTPRSASLGVIARLTPCPEMCCICRNLSTPMLDARLLHAVNLHNHQRIQHRCCNECLLEKLVSLNPRHMGSNHESPSSVRKYSESQFRQVILLWRIPCRKLVFNGDLSSAAFCHCLKRFVFSSVVQSNKLDFFPSCFPLVQLHT